MRGAPKEAYVVVFMDDDSYECVAYATCEAATDSMHELGPGMRSEVYRVQLRETIAGASLPHPKAAR